MTRVPAGAMRPVAPLELAFLVLRELTEAFGAEVVHADVRTPSDGEFLVRIPRPASGHSSSN